MELKELQDQEQRQHSVIMRGFGTNDVDLAKKKFEDICLFLNIDVIELSELIRIGDTALFRRKIRDKEKRLLLLSEVKKVRLSDNYKSVYI